MELTEYDVPKVRIRLHDVMGRVLKLLIEGRIVGTYKVVRHFKDSTGTIARK